MTCCTCAPQGSEFGRRGGRPTWRGCGVGPATCVERYLLGKCCGHAARGANAPAARCVPTGTMLVNL
eukprot:10062935-Alexandrium_andersonii.AAC.1